MIDLHTLAIIVWMHFFADFVLQSDHVAKNKSTSNAILGWHVLVYSLPFFYFGWVFAVVNSALHFITDWCTSRVTSKLYKAQEIHWFFVVIGFDQAIHITCLVATYFLLVQ